MCQFSIQEPLDELSELEGVGNAVTSLGVVGGGFSAPLRLREGSGSLVAAVADTLAALAAALAALAAAAFAGCCTVNRAAR